MHRYTRITGFSVKVTQASSAFAPRLDAVDSFAYASACADFERTKRRTKPRDTVYWRFMRWSVWNDLYANIETSDMLRIRASAVTIA